MLKRAWILWALVAVNWGVCSAIQHFGMRDDLYGDLWHGLEMVCDVSGAVFRLAIGVLVFSVLDKIMLPWLNIEDAMMGSHDWGNTTPQVRAATVGGWWLLFATVLYAFLIQ